MAEHGDMAETSDEHSNGVTEPDDVDLGEIRDELPADLDPSQVTAPYLFPNNSRRKIPAVLYTLIGIGCIVGGAFGNIIDRLHYGMVVDFLDFHAAGYHFPTFNLADSAITIGVGFWLLRGTACASWIAVYLH